MIKVMIVALVMSVNLVRTARLNSHETREIENFRRVCASISSQGGMVAPRLHDHRPKGAIGGS